MDESFPSHCVLGRVVDYPTGGFVSLEIRTRNSFEEAWGARTGVASIVMHEQILVVLSA